MIYTSDSVFTLLGEKVELGKCKEDILVGVNNQGHKLHMGPYQDQTIMPACYLGFYFDSYVINVWGPEG